MKYLIHIIIISILSIGLSLAQTPVSNFRNFANEKEYEKAGELAQQVLNENPNDFDIAMEVGDVYTELEEYSKALNAYSKARSISDKGNKALAKHARTLTALERSKEAIEELKKPLEKDKKNMELLIALADAYLHSGDVKNAEVQINNARSIDNKNAEVFIMLGNIYYDQSIWELARTNFEDALKLNPNDVLARQRLAEVYWKLAVAADNAGEPDLLNEYLKRSLEECNTLVQNDPKDANSWRLKGQIHFNANQNLDAAQSYNKFIELRPNNHKERWRLAEILANNGVCDEAIPHLEVISKRTPDDVITDSVVLNAQLFLATCYYKEKRYEEATKTFDVAAAYMKTLNYRNMLNATDVKIWALSYLFLGDTTNALTTFNELFEMAPAENCDIMLLVGARICNPRKMYSEVIRILSLRNTTCDADENTPYCYYLIGTANFELKNIDASIAALQKSIEVNPQYYYAYIYLGDVYINQKNVAEGEKLFNFVIDNAKADVTKYSNELNIAFQKLAGQKLDAKKYGDLQKIAKQWLDLLPDKNEYAYLYLAVAYQGLGDQPNACKNYREVLKINPDNKAAKDNIKNLGC
ncbi:MAG: tetratricopeptide repeat protein [Ignavibacteria bacterium]|jgi:tetratricopeptide (TPR) repeat protein|nr:tetratricopeptide repeat protein [Ignavibacteria bacterium]